MVLSVRYIVLFGQNDDQFFKKKVWIEMMFLIKNNGEQMSKGLEIVNIFKYSDNLKFNVLIQIYNWFWQSIRG